MGSTEHGRKQAGEFRGRLPSNGPDLNELVEVPQRDGTVLVKRRGDLDFDDISARARAAGDLMKPQKPRPSPSSMTIEPNCTNEVSPFHGETKEYFEILIQEFIHTLDYVDRSMLCSRTETGMRLTLSVDEYDKFNENIGL